MIFQKFLQIILQNSSSIELLKVLNQMKPRRNFFPAFVILKYPGQPGEALLGVCIWKHAILSFPILTNALRCLRLKFPPVFKLEFDNFIHT